MRDFLGAGSLINLAIKKKKNTKKTSNKLSRKFRKNQIAVGLILPIFLAFSYFYLIGRKRYFVRSDVIVRKAANENSSSLNFSGLFGTGNQSSIEDAKYLRTFLESSQILDEAEKEFPFKELYKKKFPDFYAGIPQGASKELTYHIFRKQIRVQLDESTGILRVITLGFDPKIALQFNQFLLTRAENFVNELNQDIYKKQLEFASEQILLNKSKVNIASKELLEFQKENIIFNPNIDALSLTSLINTMESELVSKKLELSNLELNFIDQEAPEILNVKKQISDLNKQIFVEKKALVSSDGRNLNEKSLKLEQLKANLDFARDLYKTALATAENSRLDSLQKQRFIVILSKPFEPEEQWNYWRHKGILTTISILLISFLLIKFILGMADSHQN